MGKKKLLFIIENLCAGGAQKALVALLKNLDYDACRVTLCVLFHEGVYWDEIPPRVKVVVLYKTRNSFCRRSFRRYVKQGSTWRMSLQIKRKTGLRYDAIVSFLEGHSLLFHDLIRHRARKNITWVHCDLPRFHWTANNFRDTPSEMACYAHMDRIVFVSGHAMESFYKAFDVQVPGCCIYNLIDRDQIGHLAGQTSAEPRCTTVTAIGTLNAVKAFDRLVRVAGMFRDEGYDIRFRIVGMGEDEAPLKRLCEELGVQDRVTLTGFVRNPYPYLKNSDMLVSTSLSEGLPLVICEAMCLGIPVVATRTAGAEELLGDDEYGIVAGQDDRSIFESMKKMIDDPGLRSHYAAKSSERAEVFDRDEVLARIGKLLE